MESSENKNPFIVQSGTTQMAWLFNQGDIVTKAMEGVFTERAGNLEGIQRILDLGCGSGLWAMEVARLYPHVHVTGVDINASLIPYVRSHAEVRWVSDNTTFLVKNILEPLDFPDASFDLINERTLFSSLSPQHWPPLLQECRRLLRPGGIIRLTELERSMTTSPALERYWDLYARALYLSGRSFSQNDRWIGIIPRLGNLIHDAGFEHIQSRAYTPLVASWHDDFASWKQHFHVIASLLEPFIVSSGVISKEEFTRLRERIDLEMLAEDFTEMPVFVTVWGNKPDVGA